ncbi:protein mono-ADP-ribosyltransferase PARP14-like isoform X5 [Gadus macrocephalus]|uniref:protein mono-ADP-ribosyltransferase PARP14-like isoform X5 n=1 Tax=Gadus macrocephalus TaxID=80720 RepID=UPI0028CB28E0|nr:protein mono-ADP-ribosyltransferase PARP14-like isoform X5 [Gadus macrocephalus]
MAGKTLILEGLTADLDDQIKSKLALYFKNKRRSGGEISELRADPTDERRVVLVYVDDKDRNEVLSRKTHQVDLKGSLGVVTLHVTLPQDVKPEPVLSSEEDFVCYDEAKEDAALLRVTSERCRESLEMFFEQCIKDPILRKHGKNTWILQMSNKSDMESVCASNPQQYGISVDVYEGKEEEDLVDSRRYVLSGLDDCCPSDTISMYIHSCSQRAEHSWEAVGGDSIVVTFKEDIDGCQFMTKTFTKRFNNKKIEACHLELTKSVIVQGDMSQMSEQFLTLYFSDKMRSGGDIIKSFVHVNQNKSIVITFEDWKVAQRVAERKHTVMEKVLVAQLFYPDLQWVLTGQTHLQDNFSTDIAIPVTPDLLSFINRNEIFREELSSALQRVQAIVSFNIISKHPQLELKMSLNKYSLGHFRHGPSWETNARREVQTHLEKYIVEHIPMKAEVWQRVKGSCPEVNVATALISFKICSSELLVVGRWEEVETLVKEIKSKMEKASDELHVVKNTIEKEIQFDSKEMLDLTLDLVRDELVNVDLSKNNEHFTIHLKGLSEKVEMAETLIQKVQDTLTSKKLDSSQNLVQFLQSLDLTKFQNDHFSLDNIVAVVICGKESVTVLAKKGDIVRAENKLKEVIKQEALSISGEYNKEKFGEQWKTFNAELKKELDATQNSQNVLIEFSEDKIKLCGFRSVVDIVIAKVKGCLENKKVVTKDIPLKTLQEVEFVESFMNLPADPQLKALGVTVLPCRSPQSPCLKVTATSDQIKEAIHVVKSHIKTIATRKYMYSKAGEAKILKDNISLLKMQAKGLCCNLKLSEQNIPQRFSYYLKGGVTLTLSQGNIAEQTSDVLICPLVNTSFNNPVAQQFLKNGGPEIKNAIVRLERLKQSLVTGDVIMTIVGTLKSKRLIYAAIPVWGKSNSDLNSTHLVTAVLQSLLKGANHQCGSLGMPALGCGTFGCPVKDSCEAIMKGISGFIGLGCGSMTTIHLTESDPKTVEGFKSALESLGYHPTDPTKTKIPLIPSSPGASQTVALPPLQVSNTIVKIKSALIELKKGNITAETVKAIVNSTNEDVNLKNGVSGAILNAAGSAVEVECVKIRPLRGNDAGVTSGGSLQCDFIIHIVGPKSLEQAVERVKNVLKHCEDKKIPSVSFPAIGTGGGGMKFQDSVFALLSGIEAHFSKHKFSALKQIFLVVDQVKAMKECQQVLLSWTQVTQDLCDDDDSNNESSGDDDNSGATTAEMFIGRVKVKLFCGDITKEKTDAIVSSTNASLNLNSGVSGAILNAAGQAVVDECNNLGNQPGDGVVITKPGNLTAKHIIHMVGQTKVKDIISSMLKVFKMCEDHKIQSVSFPALSTGAGKLCAVDVGNAMVTAVEDHIKMTKTPSLKDVHIVIFQTNMFQDFRKSLKKCKILTPTVKRVTAQAKISAPQGGAVAPTQQPSMCLAGACGDVSFPKVNVEVLGCCSSDLANVKKLVDDLVTKEWKLHHISSPYLALLLPSEKQAIVALSRSLQVCVSVSAPDKATMSGKEADVLTMVLQIEKDLQKAKERATRQEEEKRLWKTVRWEVCDREAWAELDPSVSLDLEHALHKKVPSISYTLQNQTYTVNLDKMERTGRNGTIARIKRTLKAGSEIAVIEPPRNWDRMDDKTLDIVDLSPSSEQYKRVQANFLQTSKDPNSATSATFTVVKIQRIQSKDQWQRYAVKKQMLDKKYPRNKNEMDLYHGTTAKICQKVNSNGFNRSFCGRNATVYGNGTYFAKQSWYSCNDTYSNPDAQGLKYMYQARVLVGKPCLGTPGMVEPAPLDPNNPYSGLHDCAVDNVQSPFIYVVFCDAGAYPDYLISFKAS